MAGRWLTNVAGPNKQSNLVANLFLAIMTRRIELWPDIGFFYFCFFFFVPNDTTDVPVVRLDLGSKLQAPLIKEGDDVYMECSIRAHPWITKVMWKHNVISAFE